VCNDGSRQHVWRDFVLQRHEDRGVKPIIGCETYIARGSRKDKAATAQAKKQTSSDLLAQNYEGYQNLVRLRRRHTPKGFTTSRESIKSSGSAQQRLIGLSACMSGVPSALLLRRSATKRLRAIEFQRFSARKLLSRDQEHGLDAQRRIRKSLVELSTRTECHSSRQTMLTT
jgi:DNA polymerase-3 subunit alpha